ncbi:homoserine acetyltransferase [Methanobrevibacter sp.]|uniref:homoserine acetyltransferase n=1 Tax=Methanobrevibacter sp. TaxID=66852 RepID=UPI003890064A
MIDDSDLGYNIYTLDEFKFDYGNILHDVEVEYTTSGTPIYDDEGNIINAVILCYMYNGNYSSVIDFHQLIGPDSPLAELNFFYISISSLGHPNSCSPSTTNLKYDFPSYSIKNRVDFKRKFLVEKFNITNVLGIFGVGSGGYEAYTWACEYPDEMEFLIITSSSFKTNGHRYIASRVIDSIIDSSDAYYDDLYSESLSKIMVTINRLIYSQHFSKKIFQNLTKFEIDALMDDFVDEGLFMDIYDLKYGNDAILNFDVEDKLSNIKAKTLVVSSSEDIYFSPEFDVYPLKGIIENLEIFIFDDNDFVFYNDYSVFVDVFKEFLNEFKK